MPAATPNTPEDTGWMPHHRPSASSTDGIQCWTMALYYMLSHTAMVQHWLPSVLLADGLWWGIQPVSSGVFGVAAGMAVTLLWSWVGPRESLQR